MTYKVVRDPIHGDIRLEGYFLDLLETPEVQRLYNIKQLGFAHLVFPGAHHTRLEHSLGTFKIASQISEVLNIKEDDILRCAALLHDIGHGPFSHTLESILLERFGVNHVDLTEKLILGKYEVFGENEKEVVGLKVNEVLDEHGICKEEIVRIIRGNIKQRPYLSQILSSAIDADQLDYLMRDAYYTGVAYGMIDIERLLNTLKIHKENLTVKRKGIGVVENILMARSLMYSSVYFHKTVRIAELMLSKALEEVSYEPFEFFKMTDAEIMNELKKVGGFSSEIVTRLKYRRLFKPAYSTSIHDLDKNQIKIVKKLEDPRFRKEKERELEDIFGIPKGHLIIDAPTKELLMAEPRINKTDIKIVDGDIVKNLDEYTPIAKAIRLRGASDWVVMIVTDEKFRKEVSEKAEKYLFE
jgi:hypothetical protein